MKIRHLFTKALPIVALIAATALTVGNASAQEAKAEPVKAVPAKATPVKKAVVGTPNMRALTVAVDLISKTQIEGTLTDTTQLQMQSSFGTVDIPLTEVAGIKFASSDDPSTTVVMLNGDSITGATDVKLITVETEWGTATINGVSIASIMFVPGLSWNSQSGLNGSRWNLNDTKKAAAAAAPSPPRSTNGRPTTTRSTQNQGRPVQTFPNNGFQSFPN